MLDENDTPSTTDLAPGTPPGETPVGDTPTAAKKTARKAAKKTGTRATKKTAASASAPDQSADQPGDQSGDAATGTVESVEASGADAPAKKTAKKAAAKKTAKKTATRTIKKAAAARAESEVEPDSGAPADSPAEAGAAADAPAAAPSLLFKAPEPTAPAPRRKKAAAAKPSPEGDDQPAPAGSGDSDDSDSDRSDGPDGSGDSDDSDSDDSDEQGGNRRRRRRGGRRRRKSGAGEDGNDASDGSPDDDSSDSEGGSGQGRGQQGRNGGGRSGQNKSGSGPDDNADSDGADGSGSRRRRRRRRTGDDSDGGGGGNADPQNTVTRVRKPRSAEDEITSLHGSTRLEAKKQRRREGREAGRRRAPIVSEAEFLARREAVDRVMVIRQRKDLTQIAVLEDKVLVEHYVARESQTSLIGNVYLGRVQNVLPSMEAAFIDIGKGRNAVLYAGEVNWSALGAGNGPRKIEQVLKSGQPILVQVSKDPIGHKGARLTSQVSLPGRFLVYVPDGTTSGISRKLPDTERTRLKTLLKEMVPDSAGVIVRTAAEGASEDELTLDVERLTARWSDIESKVEKGNAPQLLYGEPDLTLKVVRDLFTEDFGKLVVSGDDAWGMVDGYVKHVAPELEERLEHYSADDEDVFAAYRIDEQIAKGLDRKVWLPSGGSLIVDRTEAMTVVDVNTGKFTGSGGNLEETVTKNNLEAAEEMVRQLRLRDIGGIIVVDFIDMVLESNRDLVLRRLVECLGRDRTRHQVAEVTSLGLVQMTRKRIGTGLLEAFSENCEHCQGRGLSMHHEPVAPRRVQDEEPRRGRRGRNRGDGNGANGNDANGNDGNGSGESAAPKASPSPKDVAAMAKHEHKPTDQGPERTAEKGPEKTPEESPKPDSATSPDATPEQAPDTTPETAPEQPKPTPTAGVEDEQASRPDPDPDEAQSAADNRSAPAAQLDQAEEPGQPDETPAPPVVPAGPRLVSSSRRRVARRPAGPPAGAPEQQDSAPAAGPQEVTDAPGPAEALGEAPGEETETPHVPIKKKGSRKR